MFFCLLPLRIPHPGVVRPLLMRPPLRLPWPLPALCFLLTVAACDGLFPDNTPPPEPVFPSDIVRVDVAPNPVMAGDTATFTAVSDPPIVKHSWTFADGSSTTSVGGTVRWAAPEAPGTYEHRVVIFDAATSVDDTTFTVRVVARP